MSRPTLVPRARGPHGFVLVGVIMFVLALTIIGLTLFDLSGYEAQFFERSVDDQQAYQLAMGGVEWAKWALGVQSDLSVVRKTPLPEGIAYVRARYADNPADSSDIGTSVPVDWSGARPIEIRVLALHHLAREMVEMTYRPKPPHEYYRRLATVVDPMVVAIPTTGRTTTLDGNVWSAAPDSIFLSCISPASEVGHPIYTGNGVDLPDVVGYVQQRLADPATTEVPEPDHTKQPTSNRYTLTAPVPGQVAYYKSTGFSANNYPGMTYSVFNTDGEPKPTASVSGMVVWVFEHGAHFDQRLEVLSGGAGQNCLILVANPSLDLTRPALDFLGGIQSLDVPVFLVSNGEVSVRHQNSGGEPGKPFNSTVNYLSVYARQLTILGPEYGYQHLFHDTSAGQDAPGQLVDDLLDQAALPLPAGVRLRGKFEPVAGTWREVEETNPN